MITAHLPAGYCLASVFGPKSRAVMVAALVGAVLPDADVAMFYLVDAGSIHHHRYWPHIPLFWAFAALIALPLLSRTTYLRAGIAFFAGVLLHLVLDTLNGGILWLYPFDDRLITLIEVPATQAHWILSFILHWTFLAEIAIWIAAATLWLRRRKETPAQLQAL